MCISCGETAKMSGSAQPAAKSGAQLQRVASGSAPDALMPLCCWRMTPKRTCAALRSHQGARRLRLGVLDGNEHARALYARRGFGEHAHVLTKALE